MKKKVGVYIHIPFCRRRCFYCHFVKFKYRERAVGRYVQALTREIGLRADTRYRVDTLYLGGGSPSLLKASQVAAIREAIGHAFALDPEAEITLEANPEDVTPEKLQSYRQLGINRLSIGIQSFVPEDLVYLKRNHSVAQGIEAVQKALSAGLSNLNVDFIIGLPGQTKKTITRSLSTLKQIPVPHVSAYLLEGVKEEKAGEEKRDHELYHFTRQSLIDLGYRHYEVSNFARPGFPSRHNLKYWENKDYLGIGAAAAGYEYRRDYKNVADLGKYFHYLDRGLLPVEEYDAKDPRLRKIIMGLRLVKGISEKNFKSHQYRDALDFLLSGGFLIRRGQNIAVAPDKVLLLNEILSYFL
jgi:oxygen-independent coproporphyrinogen-3 oxidase